MNVYRNVPEISQRSDTRKKTLVKDNEKSLDSKKKYEETYERSFQSKRLLARSWLKCEEWLMFCTACKDDGVTEWESVFVKGSAVMRLDVIKYHEVLMSYKE